VTKGRKQKLDNCGVRLHNSGCARCEGYYELSMKEKAKYLEAARRQVDRSEAVKKDNAKVRGARECGGRGMVVWWEGHGGVVGGVRGWEW
jgi:hypothetical protein